MLFLGKNICLFCKENRSLNENYMCASCIDLLEIVNIEEALTESYLERVYYSLIYNKFTRANLHKFKFQGKSYLHKPFGEILIDTIKMHNLDEKIQHISFVPSHRRKKARRGYNQSELLANYIGKKLELPILKKHLKKVRNTKDQSTLGKVARRKNLKNSFQTRNINDFKYKNILLIDDIITTGTTLEECSKVLMDSGARKVYGLALTSSERL